MHNPVNWFEIPVSDLNRAKVFYETVFDFEITLTEMGSAKMGFFPFAPDGPGATGTLIQQESYVPSHAGTLSIFRLWKSMIFYQKSKRMVASSSMRNLELVNMAMLLISKTVRETV